MRDYTFKKTLLYICLFFSIISFAGCKERLYGDLPEKDINEMLALLLQNNISCEKMQGEELTWSLHVEKNDIDKALKVLNDYGYPKESYQSIGDVFQKEGLISSPLEERIRFIYALSQEVSATISRIDGVLVARVHVVLPENDPFSDSLVPSSASVFIKHRSDVDIKSSVHKITELVVNSIEGLDYKKVSVALFPTDVDFSASMPRPYVKVLGVKVSLESESLFRLIIVCFVLLLAAAGVAIVYLYNKAGFTFKKGKTGFLNTSKE